jgi:Carboxypeptidase regulatory-like domain
MARGTGTVEGVVTGADGKPEGGVMVVLVPASGENFEPRKRTDQSDSDGTFMLGGAVPGRYVLMAIENGWDFDTNDETVLKQYREKGLALQIAPRETKRVTVEATK